MVVISCENLNQRLKGTLRQSVTCTKSAYNARKRANTPATVSASSACFLPTTIFLARTFLGPQVLWLRITKRDVDLRASINII
jgi:hypothetical protein